MCCVVVLFLKASMQPRRVGVSLRGTQRGTHNGKFGPNRWRCSHRGSYHSSCPRSNTRDQALPFVAYAWVNIVIAFWVWIPDVAAWNPIVPTVVSAKARFFSKPPPLRFCVDAVIAEAVCHDSVPSRIAQSMQPCKNARWPDAAEWLRNIVLRGLLRKKNTLPPMEPRTAPPNCQQV